MTLPARGLKGVGQAVELEGPVIEVKIPGRVAYGFGNAGIVLGGEGTGIEIHCKLIVSGPAGDDGCIGQQSRIVGVQLQ